MPRRRLPLGPELELVPTRNRSELEQRPAAAAGMLVRELGVALVPHHLERTALHLVVEPRAAEDQLAQPVDERLVVDERDALPVADEVPAELRLRLLDDARCRERDQVGGLL